MVELTPKQDVQMFLRIHAPSDAIFLRVFIKDLLMVMEALGEDFPKYLKEALDEG